MNEFEQVSVAMTKTRLVHGFDATPELSGYLRYNIDKCTKDLAVIYM